MKKIEAFIKAHRLDDVTLALHDVEGLTGMTVTEARGRGRGRGSGHDPDDFHKVVRIEVFCADALSETIIRDHPTGQLHRAARRRQDLRHPCRTGRPYQFRRTRG